VDVISDKIKNPLDRLVGKLDVEKKMENQVGQFKTTVDQLQEAKIGNEVKLEKLEGQVNPWIDQRTRIKTVMSKFSEHLNATQEVDVAGFFFTRIGQGESEGIGEWVLGCGRKNYQLPACD